MEEVVSSNLTRSTKPNPYTPRELPSLVAVSPPAIITTKGPNTVQKSVFHRRLRGMDRTAFPTRLIALIPRPVGMRGSHGKRFDARAPLGRHFSLFSRYIGFFHPIHTPRYAWCGWCGSWGFLWSPRRPLRSEARAGIATAIDDGFLLAHVARPLPHERASAVWW